ncbi:MAG: glycosyltransferase family 39 protein [Deltaproteobacteria bacterium]|nr:glycosyltransferase family 39 protein [Deltaproteobacteria bacterium]
MSRTARALRAAQDPLIALACFTGTLALLIHTSGDLGYARDEGFYFRAAADYQRWFELLFRDPSAAITKAAVDRHWRANHEHPALVKSLFALSYKFLHQDLGLVREGGLAYRLPGMAFSALGVSVTYLWGARAVSRLGGLVAALLLLMQPQVFYHSHLACFDMAVLTMWLVTTYAYARTLEGGGVGWVLLTGLLYGLELDTKHNAWLLPPALVVHWAVTRVPPLLRAELAGGRLRPPAALFAMALLGPPVFLALWPWLWFDTASRFLGYARFHLHHDYYNMEFLGTTYFRPPMPRAYAWVMTAATVPTIALLLAALGGLRSLRELPTRARLDAAGAERGALARAFSTRCLWLLCIGTSYAPWLRTSTPIFGGTKHWITAYSFLCLFAAVGFDWVARRLAEGLSPRLRRLRVAELCAAALVVAAPIATTLHSHPFGLSAYVPLFGGQPGGASLGLNRSFWGYTTGSLLPALNERAPSRAAVYLHDTAQDAWDRTSRDGRARKDLRGTLSIVDSRAALYHHEQHMQKVEYQLWMEYGTVAPEAVALFDGVPVAWLYVRPGQTRR